MALDIKNYMAIDITKPECPVEFEVQQRENGYVVYLHVNGISVARVCQVKEVQVRNEDGNLIRTWP